MASQLGEEWSGQQALQADLIERAQGRLSGYCIVCEHPAQFGFQIIEGAVNWRESLKCERCGLINRWRASAHLFTLLSRPAGSIYVTEQTTSLFQHLRAKYSGVIGSEFVSSDCASGEMRTVRDQQIRHEDLTALSMPDASLAAVLSFDVLEHVPDYRKAVAELARALMPGGLLLLTAPFSLERMDTVQRARVGENGEIEHILPAQYHGDPLSEDGVLCFQEFGWDLLDLLRARGFCSACVVTVWAPNYGYLDTAQPFIVARR